MKIVSYHRKKVLNIYTCTKVLIKLGVNSYWTVLATKYNKIHIHEGAHKI